jgi:hypothetical protein
MGIVSLASLIDDCLASPAQRQFEEPKWRKGQAIKNKSLKACGEVSSRHRVSPLPFSFPLSSQTRRLLDSSAPINPSPPFPN